MQSSLESLCSVTREGLINSYWEADCRPLWLIYNSNKMFFLLFPWLLQVFILTVLGLLLNQPKTKKDRYLGPVATPSPHSELSPSVYHFPEIHKPSILPSSLRTSNVILVSHQLNLEQDPSRPHTKKNWWLREWNILHLCWCECQEPLPPLLPWQLYQNGTPWSQGRV